MNWCMFFCYCLSSIHDIYIRREADDGLGKENVSEIYTLILYSSDRVGEGAGVGIAYLTEFCKAA